MFESDLYKFLSKVKNIRKGWLPENKEEVDNDNEDIIEKTTY